MFEIIVDVTNKCFMQCKYCGTDSSQGGNAFLPAEIIEEILEYAKENSCRVYLGGGCFFCHPDYKRLLMYIQAIEVENIIIDVPMHISVLSLLQRYPMSLYNYCISVSLWGTENTHNTLSDSDGWCLIHSFHNEMVQQQGHAAYSFVITKELIEQEDSVVRFLNQLEASCKVYFHRLMPTGRCHSDELPTVSQIRSFSTDIQSRSKIVPRFHHTIYGGRCVAYKERIFIDYDGSIYGCGWVGNNKPITNIRKTKVSSLLKDIKNYTEYTCPLNY